MSEEKQVTQQKKQPADNNDEIELAFITGINGQDGSFLAELLLQKATSHVWGMTRPTSSFNTDKLLSIRNHPNLHLIYGSIEDLASIQLIFTEIEKAFPNYKSLSIFHYAAQSHVGISFGIPIHTTNINAIGTANLLHCIHQMGLIPRVRLVNAATSELFGEILESRQDENTRFNVLSPYACSKLFAFNQVKIYRKSYGMFACNSIAFNHESERRKENFVSRKVTKHIGAVVNAINNNEKILPIVQMGNLDSRRDWGFSRDYVKGMIKMLQQDQPDDYVLATDENHSVRDLLELGFHLRNLHIRWEGNGLLEKGYLIESESIEYPKGQIVISVSDRYFRPSDVEVLLGNSTKSRTVLNWKPELNFEQLISRMLYFDCPNYPTSNSSSLYSITNTLTTPIEHPDKEKEQQQQQQPSDDNTPNDVLNECHQPNKKQRFIV